jgi:hypothetical protein
VTSAAVIRIGLGPVSNYTSSLICRRDIAVDEHGDIILEQARHGAASPTISIRNAALLPSEATKIEMDCCPNLKVY